MLEFFQNVRDLISAEAADGSHAWIGHTAPVDGDFAIVDLHLRPGFRALPADTGRFHSVWLVEKAVEEQGWRILIDSAIRMLEKSGFIVIRHVQNQYISIPALKNFLFRKYGLVVSVTAEKVLDGDIVTAFHIERVTSALSQNKLWTFGILTQGKKPEMVAQMCATIRRFGGIEHEILIVGPQNDLYKNYNPLYIDKIYSHQLADICVKKNDIVQRATHENLCILHDRYWLYRDFFTGFDQFGYDFDYLTIQQYHQSGKNYPSYCAIDDRGHLIWGNIFECGNENQTWNRHYLNGGFLIAKTALLKAIPFNPLLFHNQAEDVELARQLEAVSVVARINRLSSALTDVPDYLTDVFKIAPTTDYDSVYCRPEPLPASAQPAPEQRPDDDVNPRPWGRFQGVIERMERRRRNGASWKGIAFLSAQAVYRCINARMHSVANIVFQKFRHVHISQLPSEMEGINILLHAGDAGCVLNIYVHYIRSLMRRDVPLRIIDIDRGAARNVLPADLIAYVGKKPIYPTNVWCIGLPYFRKRLADEAAWATDRWNAHFAHWELPYIPKRLADDLSTADSFIVDSEYVRDALQNVTEKPVFLIDPEISILRSAIAQYDRAYFGLPQDKVLFLLDWEYTSSTARKNPQAGIDAFNDAFDIVQNDVALVMHVKYEMQHGDERLQHYKTFLEDIRKNHPNIILIEKNSFSYEEALGLKLACDCYVSLHRAEAYGMGCAEALSLGQRCVMTGWSGNMELMKNPEWASRAYTVAATLIPVSPDDHPWVSADDDVHQLWADVRHGDAVRKLKSAYLDIKTTALI